MRFSARNYEKAFPRSEKKPVKVEVAPEAGNVIEEAEQDPEVPEEPETEIETPEDGGEADGDE